MKTPFKFHPKTFWFSTLLGVFALAMSPSASAAIIVQYDMDSVSVSDTEVPTTVNSSFLTSATDITLTGITDAATSNVGTNSSDTSLGSISAETGFSGTVSAGGFSGNAFQVDDVPVGASGLSATHYFEFTIDPSTAVELSEVYLDIWTPLAVSGSDRNTTLQIDSGAGFTEVGTATIVGANNAQVLRYTFDVSSIASTSNDVTFRFNPWSTGTDTGNGNDRRRIDNLTVTVVPEPNTAVLLLAGIAGACVMLRRRRRAA